MRHVILAALTAIIVGTLALNARAACIPNTGTWTITTTGASLGVCAGDWSTVVTVGGTSSVPAGMIAMFNGACPTGWTEYTGARGRVVVGVPAAGTLAATVGTALTDAQNRAVTPTFTGSSANTSSVTAGTPAGTNSTSATTGNCAATNIAAGTGSTTACKATAPNLTVSAQTFTGSALAGHQHAVTATGTVSAVATADVMAYVQLRFCSKD